jgi:hypothetical protein
VRFQGVLLPYWLNCAVGLGRQPAQGCEHAAEWLEDHLPVGRLASVTTWTLVSLSAVYLAVGESLTRIPTPWGVSLNLVVTFFLVGVAVANACSQRRYTSVAIASAVAILTLGTGLSAGSDLRAMQYLAPLVVFLLLATAKISDEIRAIGAWVLWAGALVSFVPLVLRVLLESSSTSRATDSIVPLVAAVLLFLPFRARWVRYVSLSISLATLVLVYWSTARVASFLIFVVVTIWILTAAPWAKAAKMGTCVLLAAGSAWYWIGSARAYERLFGRDNTLAIGPMRLNGEGRSDASEIVRGDLVDLSIPELMLGKGAGRTGTVLTDAGYHLDKPHEEFLRLFVDGGLLLVGVWIAVIAITTFAAWQGWRDRAGNGVWQIPAVVSLSATLLSLVDNPLSYIWFMLPAAVLARWGAGERRTRTFPWTGPFTKRSQQSGARSAKVRSEPPRRARS